MEIQKGGKIEKKMAGKYDDIINLPHHVSSTHPHMSMTDRAAQFSPFAALTGYGDAVEETRRLTDAKVELDENKKVELNKRLQLIQARIMLHPIVEITYFLPDDRKDGGVYRTVTGAVRKIDEYVQEIVLMDQTRILLDDIVQIGGDLFYEY